MALTLTQMKALADDPTFRGQVQMVAIRHSLTQILAGSTTHSEADRKRWALAASTLADGCTANLTRFAYGVAGSPGLTATAGTPPTMIDADVITAVLAVWDKLAGITAGDAGG
jgi:hypothetical protein